MKSILDPGMIGHDNNGVVLHRARQGRFKRKYPHNN